MFVGSSDVPISAEGGRQALGLAGSLRAAAPDVCYCSPLVRARQTAEILLQHCPMPIHAEDDLREIDFGRWECKTFDQIAADDPKAVQRWARYDQRFTFPGGECLGGFLARVRRIARRLVREEAATALVVTHGGIIRALICHFLRLRPREYVLFNVAHASCTIIDLFDDKGVLAGLNLRSLEGC